MSLDFIIVICLLIFSTVQCNGNNLKNDYVYWEDLSKNQKKEILDSQEIDKEVLAFYNGEFKLGDNEQTTILLNKLSSATSEAKSFPLYFFLFNQVCTKSDGAISELLGNYCQKVILNSPECIFHYFIENENLLKIYAQYLGYELYFKEEGTSNIKYNLSDFRKIVLEKLKSNEQYNDVFLSFFDEIEKVMKNMD